MIYRGRTLHTGSATGDVLHLRAALSFWGGFDAATGTIIDRNHPDHGACVTGTVVLMPGSRGSSGTPGVLGESLRLGTGPAALVLDEADINLVAGALTATTLYGASCPVILLDTTMHKSVPTLTSVTITAHSDGAAELTVAD